MCSDKIYWHVLAKFSILIVTYYKQIDTSHFSFCICEHQICTLCASSCILNASRNPKWSRNPSLRLLRLPFRLKVVLKCSLDANILRISYRICCYQTIDKNGFVIFVFWSKSNKIYKIFNFNIIIFRLTVLIIIWKIFFNIKYIYNFIYRKKV